MTRRAKKRKGFCGNPSKSSTTSSDPDNSTVVEQHDDRTYRTYRKQQLPKRGEK